MSDRETTDDTEALRSTEFYRKHEGGVLIAAGPMEGRKRPALVVGRHDSPRRTVVAYFQDEEARQEFEKAMRELLTGFAVEYDEEGSEGEEV